MIIFRRYANPEPTTQAPSSNDADTVIRLDIPSALHSGAVASLRYRVDERSGFVRANGWWLHVSTPLGLECYPEVNALLASAREAGLHKVLERLEDLRLLAFVAYCEVTEQVFFGRGLDGFCSLYFGGHGPDLVVSDDRLEVAQLIKRIALSRNDREEWCKYARLSPESSFFEGVKRCFAGVRYCSHPKAACKLRRHLMTPQANELSSINSVQLLQDGLMHAFSYYGDRRIALRLSGGVDSRVLLVGLLEAVKQGILRKEQILCLSVLYPGLDCDESEEIRAIIRLAGIHWVGITATSANVDEAYGRSLQLSAPPFPTSFMGSLCMREAKKHGVQIVVSGHGGDEIFDFDLTDLLAQPLLSRLRGLRLIAALRNAVGLVQQSKSLACALLGRRAARTTIAMVKAYALQDEALLAHRLGRRLLLAQGNGYEMSACGAASLDMMIDAPFLRGPFFNCFDPSGLAIKNRDTYKRLAFAYIDSYAPQFCDVPARKVEFGSVLNSYFPPTRQKCDSIDDKSTYQYARRGAYSDWSEASFSKGNSTHGKNH